MSTPSSKPTAEELTTEFRDRVKDRADIQKTLAEQTAELVKLAFEINKARMSEGFPNIDIAEAGVVTLKANDSGGTAAELIGSFDPATMEVLQIIADPVRLTVTVIYRAK